MNELDRFEALLSDIEKPGRYIGNESNARGKDFESSRVRFALAFPDVYEVGFSHLGLHVLYHVLNGIDGVLADRVYSPWPDFETRLRSAGEPPRALESRRPLGDFDFLGFSLQYELSFTNILTILELSGIPFLAKDRDESHPWVIAGGPCAFNPEPLADIFDFVVLGEAEELLPELVRTFEGWRAASGSRDEFLEAVRRIPGVYVPSFFDVRYDDDTGVTTDVRPRFDDYRTITKRLVADLDLGSALPTPPLVPMLEIVHDRLSAEIARGCTRGCRFCQAGFIYRPVRERDPEKLLRGIEEALAASGFEELSLLSLSTGDYRHIQAVLKALIEHYAPQRVAISFPSMRVGTLTPELMELIRRVRKTGFTVAPEAASERLRRVINKGVRDEDLLSTAESAFEMGWRVLKLYFMIGLPTETREDLEALVERSMQVWQTAKPWKAAVNVSVSTFVPKPHTPFQWAGQISRDEIEERLAFLKERFKRPGLRLKWSDPGQSRLEAVFARGDRRLLPVLVRAWELGARFDGWTDRFREDIWDRAFADTGVSASFYSSRERALDEILPWDHLSTGVDKEFLRKEYDRAVAGEFTPDCRWEQCSACGVCDHETVKPVLHPDAVVPEFPPAPRKGESAAAAHLYRLRYCKVCSARFFGQLELTQSFSRAVRRAGLAALFSKGFHPHMKMSFVGALPLGLESLVEEAYLSLAERVDPEDLKQRLNRCLPEGLHISEAAYVSGNVRQSPHRRVRYRVSRLTPSEVAAILRNSTKRLGDEITKKTKKREVRVQLGRVLLDIRQVDETSLEMDIREGPDMCFRPLAILHHLSDGSSGSFHGCGVCKTAVDPLEESGDVHRTNHQSWVL